jgi:aspartate aminotransferase-like enzyme
METCNVDVFISAPQKAWSGPACAAVVMLNSRARKGGTLVTSLHHFALAV